MITFLTQIDLAELIPASVGKGPIRKQFQNRLLGQWALLAISGLTVFYQKSFSLSSNVRVAALGLLFPGAGFIACGNIAGGFSFVLTAILIPLSLFAVSYNCTNKQPNFLTAGEVVWCWGPGVSDWSLDSIRIGCLLRCG
jgi:hypothetical protein